MKTVSNSHWLVRATCAIQGVGALLGIVLVVAMMGDLPVGQKLICVFFASLWLGTGIAAVGLWFGEEWGLQWTRLLLIAQIPVIQSATFAYLLSTGASFLLFGGTKAGIDSRLGSFFALSINTDGDPNVFLIGVNALAIAMLVLLRRVDLRLPPRPPPLPQAAN